MNKFNVILESSRGPTHGYQYLFPCMADDEQHAIEQALNAYPKDIVITVEELLK
jgi:hypothetical protein